MVKAKGVDVSGNVRDEVPWQGKINLVIVCGCHDITT